MKKALLIFLVVLVVVPGLTIGFVMFVKLPFSYDLTYAHDRFEFGAMRVGKTVDVYANGTVRKEFLGLWPLVITEPYGIEVCTFNTIQTDLRLQSVTAARVVDRELVPIKIEAIIEPTWRRENPGPTPDQFTVCTSDVLVLDIKVDSEFMFCVDVEFSVLSVGQVERSCFELVRAKGSHRATIWEVIASV